MSEHARSIRRTLGERLGRTVPASGPADELLVAVSAGELRPAVESLLALGARHVMLTGLPAAIEEVMAVPAGPLVRLRAELPGSAPAYPSLTPLVPAAQWDEREAFDIFGLEPLGHPDPRPLVHHEPAAARRFKPFVAHGDGVYQLPVGPIHAGIIEPGHFRFSAVGESVLHLDARLFYTHRGLESLVEGRTFEAALPIVERACGVCTVTHATAYSRAVERLTGTVPPPRARLARVLLAEMERLYNHVGDLGNICAGVGFNFGTSRLGWEKERLLRLNEALTGHRYLTGMVAPGGLRLDLDESALAGLAAAVREIDREVRSVVRLLVRSDSFMNRLHGTGIVHAADALRLGAVGVAARASGLRDDLRRDRPADGYLDLEIPEVEASAGDVAARFHVRAQEAAVSARLIRKIAASLPSGPIRVPLAQRPRQGRLHGLAGAEGPRGASWVWLMAGSGGQSRAAAPALGLVRQLAGRRLPPCRATSFPTSRSSTRASSSATPARTADHAARRRSPPPDTAPGSGADLALPGRTGAPPARHSRPAGDRSRPLPGRRRVRERVRGRLPHRRHRARPPETSRPDEPVDRCRTVRLLLGLRAGLPQRRHSNGLPGRAGRARSRVAACELAGSRPSRVRSRVACAIASPREAVDRCTSATWTPARATAATGRSRRCSTPTTTSSAWASTSWPRPATPTCCS